MSCPEKNCTQPHVLNEEVTATGKWLRLEKTTYVDPSGNTRIWETVKRTTRPTDTGVDGVGIIAILKRTLHKDCVVLVKQFRPPMGCYTLEFPAATCLDPGLSNCSTHIVMVNINGDDLENINPTQQLEFVDVILLPLDEFQKKIGELLKKEDLVVDSKVYIYAMGMSQAFFKPNELPVLKQ
ncbi:ADP-sugar pyrophosphatase [Bagarius yarrelli]|uniref:ADP-sugar pyrophosphatase n=1 Tax=Bagarius yarrelli TaxID=175774 RepID=A0A556THN3_BAGYA|nr:ADP-sugar pyrophosphatase [Bagarius yarrelli]